MLYKSGERKMKRQTNAIPHNRWTYLVQHKSGGNYLYVSEKELTMQEVMESQNMDTIVSISKLDVSMVVFVK